MSFFVTIRFEYCHNSFWRIYKRPRGEHSPSIEITTKLAEDLEVSVDYMLSKERFGKYDKEAIKRLEGIQKMDGIPPTNYSSIFSIKLLTFALDKSS